MGKNIEEQILFTKEECDYIKSLWNENDFKPSTITKGDVSNIVSDSRTSDSLFISSSTDEKNLILNKLNILGIKTLPSEINVLRYKKDNEFKLHTDSSSTYSDRYKTLVIQLSDENDYSGGSLILYEGTKKYEASKKLGNVVMFSSQLEHKAEKIEEGIRYSMVMWLEKTHFGFNNTLI